MIDIKVEIPRLVQGWVLNDMNDPHARESLEGRIEALCTRYGDEKAKDAAKEIEALTRYDINVPSVGISPRKNGVLLRRKDVLAVLRASKKGRE